MARPVPAVLSIAGSDSGGGAGIQADLKAFARCGVHGMTAIAALTAQNTVEVTRVHQVPGDVIVEQVRVLVEDIGVDAVKIGMLGTAETVAAVREALGLLEPGTPVVLDPVMVAESGAVLLDEAARDALIEQLLPLATAITPNLPEARVLAETASRPNEPDRPAGAERTASVGPAANGPDGAGADDAESLARALHRLGPGAVIVTGGHREQATDVFFDGDRLEPIPGKQHPDGASHGSGCTHSSALAAHLALGHDTLEAARRAKAIAGAAIRDGLRDLGRGAGPVDVFGLAARAHEASRGAAAAGRA